MDSKTIYIYRKEIAIALLLGIVAAAVGICHYRLTPDISNDGVSYLILLDSMRDQKSLSTDVPPLFLDTVWRTARLFSAGFLSTGIVLNTLFFSLTVCLCFVMVRMISGKLEPGIWCGILLIFQPYLLSFAHDFLRESMFLFLISAFLLALTCGLRYSSIWSWAIAGAFNTLAFFTRYEGVELLLFAMLGLFLSWIALGRRPKSLAISLLMFLAGCTCTVILLYVSNASFEFISILKPHMETHLRT